MSENLIIFNARIVTPIGFSARKGEEMSQLQIIENGTVEVTKGIITYVGENRGEDRDGYYQHYWHYNARGHCLLPGFVDSHTHFVFGGERSEEFSWRLKGESYMSIMEQYRESDAENELPETPFDSRKLPEEDEYDGSDHSRRKKRLRSGS